MSGSRRRTTVRVTLAFALTYLMVWGSMPAPALAQMAEEAALAAQSTEQVDDVPAPSSEAPRVAIPSIAEGLIYDGTEQVGVAAGDGYELAGDLSATHVGEYVATATPADGCVWEDGTSGSVELRWSIARKSVTVTADDKTKAKGEKDPELTATVGGLVGDDAVTYELSRDAGDDTGEYAITPSGDAVQGDYEVSFVAGRMTVTEPVVMRAQANLSASGVEDVSGELIPGQTLSVNATLSAGASVSYSLTVPSDCFGTLTTSLDKNITGGLVCTLSSADAQVDRWEIKYDSGDVNGPLPLHAGEYTLSYTNTSSANTITVTEARMTLASLPKMTPELAGAYRLESEPNGDLTTANSKDLAEELAFETMTYGTVCQGGSNISMTDDDWYHFRLTGTHKLSFELEADFMQNGLTKADFHVVIAGADGLPVIRKISSTYSEKLIWCNKQEDDAYWTNMGSLSADCGMLPAGDYYIRIMIADDAANMNMQNYGREDHWYRFMAHATSCHNPMTANALAGVVSYTYNESYPNPSSRSSNIAVNGAYGYVTYGNASLDKTAASFSVNSHSGAVEVPVGVPVGTYPLRVQVNDPGNSDHEPKSVYVLYQVKVNPSSKFSVRPVPYVTYTGRPHTPKPFVYDLRSDLTLRENVDYTLRYTNNTEGYLAYVYVTGMGNYTGTKSVSFGIDRAEITSVTLSQTSYVYDGTEKTPRVTAWAGSTIVPPTEYSVTYKNNVNVGTATVTIWGGKHYKSDKSATFQIVAPPASTLASTPHVSYRTHVQRIGWQGYVTDGAMSGTSGLSYRLEGINIKLSNLPVSGGIQYRTHVQRIGWQGWRKNGAMSGTSGKSYRLEAIEIKLYGEMANRYDVYYRVHCQRFGWMGWAKNGQRSGSAGYSRRLEGIQIVLVPKGKPAPGRTLKGITQRFSAPFKQKGKK